jgi:hypothetical protein
MDTAPKQLIGALRNASAPTGLALWAGLMACRYNTHFLKFFARSRIWGIRDRSEHSSD